MMIFNKTYIIYLFFIGLCVASNCTDSNACNYNPYAIDDDGSCYYPLNDCNQNNIAVSYTHLTLPTSDLV